MTTPEQTVTQLIGEFNHAAQSAAEQVNEAYKSALKVARDRRDQLAETATTAERKQRLKGIITNACSSYFSAKKRQETAGNLVVQMSNQLADLAQSGTRHNHGEWLLSQWKSFSGKYTDTLANRMLAALVIASDGHADTGLVEFTSGDWSAALREKDLTAMAASVAPEDLAAYENEQKENAEQLANAERQLESIQQAKPSLYTVVDDESSLNATVHNPRGDVIIEGIRIPQGMTVLSFDQLSQVRHHSLFAGNGLTVQAVDALVEAV